VKAAVLAFLLILAACADKPPKLLDKQALASIERIDVVVVVPFRRTSTNKPANASIFTTQRLDALAERADQAMRLLDLPAALAKAMREKLTGLKHIPATFEFRSISSRSTRALNEAFDSSTERGAVCPGHSLRRSVEFRPEG